MCHAGDCPEPLVSLNLHVNSKKMVIIKKCDSLSSSLGGNTSHTVVLADGSGVSVEAGRGVSGQGCASFYFISIH